MTSEEPAPRAAPPPASSNALGVAGFIVSLVGLVLTCGLLCPIGFVISLFGIRSPPRGFAIAGLAIGAVGTMVATVAAIFVLETTQLFGRMSGVETFELEGPRVTTEVTLSMAEELIEIESAEKGRLPADADGTALVASLTDGWGRALRYERGESGAFTIRSAGADGAFGTDDDVTTSR